MLCIFSHILVLSSVLWVCNGRWFLWVQVQVQEKPVAVKVLSVMLVKWHKFHLRFFRKKSRIPLYLCWRPCWVSGLIFGVLGHVPKGLQVCPQVYESSGAEKCSPSSCIPTIDITQRDGCLHLPQEGTGLWRCLQPWFEHLPFAEAPSGPPDWMHFM